MSDSPTRDPLATRAGEATARPPGKPPVRHMAGHGDPADPTRSPIRAWTIEAAWPAGGRPTAEQPQPAAADADPAPRGTSTRDPQPAEAARAATADGYSPASPAPAPLAGPPAAVEVPPIPPRGEVVQGWRRALIDAWMPDTLLFALGSAQGWLDLTHAHPSGLAQLLAGRRTRLSGLVREPGSHGTARRRARAIRAVSGDLAAERGVRAAYLAAGLATWRAPSVASGEVLDLERQSPVTAPVLLRGCTLSPRGAGHEDYDLDLDDTAVLNPEVVRRLAEQFGVALDGEALSGLAFGPEGFDPVPVFDRLEHLCAQVPGFRIDRSLVVGTFTAGSGAMLADIDAAAAAVDAGGLLTRLVDAVRLPPEPDEPGGSEPAGSQTPSTAASFGITDPDPAEDLAVLDLDPAQRRALDAALDRSHLALEGPPGTGLTHTLAAIAGALAARGRRVLVVTPRRATADAFIARLDAAGLGDLALDLQDGVGSRSQVLAGLGHSLEGAVTAEAQRAAALAPDVVSDRDRTIRESRDRLASATRALHRVREPWGVSAYQTMVALAELVARPQAPRSRVRLPGAVLTRLGESGRAARREQLREAAAIGAFTMTRRDTRWLDAQVATPVQAEAALSAAVDARDRLARARAEMAGVAARAGLTPAERAGDWAPMLELLLGVRDTLDVLLPAVFEQPLDELVSALGPRRDPQDGRGRLARRSARRRARALVRPGVHAPHLSELLVQARRQGAAWRLRAEAGGWPLVPVGLPEAEAAVARVTEAVARLGIVLAGTGSPDLWTLPLDDLERRLVDLAFDTDGVRGQSRRTQLMTSLTQAGLGDLVDDLRARAITREQVDGEFDLAWWTSVLEQIVRGDPRLARHDTARLHRAAADFRLADHAHVADGARQVRAAVARRAREVLAAYPDQVHWLRTEVHRGHRSLWPLDLFRKAPDAVAALRPVWVMSPDTVARTLPPVGRVGGASMVDVVIVDDAAHVALGEVAAALARGTQVLVAGDRRRQGAVPGLSALEAVARVAPVHRLDRDHRVRDGRMLAPVRDVYPEGWAVTYGTSVIPRLRLDEVVNGIGVPAPGEDVAVSATAEVDRVVELVVEHVRHRPEQSLMVVTLGDRHAERIEDALRIEVAERPELSQWLEGRSVGNRAEPFLVRPVQRAIGLERDCVLVSVGLARTPHGRVLHRFGVLDGSGGVPALVTALTRARLSTTVVCCFTALDLAPERLHSPGPLLLRQVLEVAAAPPGVWAEPVPGYRPDALVADLRDRLVAAGLPVVMGVGDPDWPLDVAVGDPRVRGRMLLAVDVDGPAYAARTSARERDRQRRERLEHAGWTYCRIAAMDLFRDPQAEVDRVREAWEQALGEPLTSGGPLSLALAADAGPSPGPVPDAGAGLDLLPLPISTSGTAEPVVADGGSTIVSLPKTRTSWPHGVVPGDGLDAYSPDDLERVARWVVSDGVEREADEVAAEVRSALGLLRPQDRDDPVVHACARRALAGAGPA